MSYRTFKKLMGETNLERKFRFLFGGGLMLLITGSFYFYARQTTKLVEKQTRETARKLVRPALIRKHLNVGREELPLAIQQIEATTQDDPQFDYLAGVYRVDSLGSRERRVPDQVDNEPVEQVRNAAPEDGQVVQIRSDDNGREMFYYYQGVYAQPACLDCHNAYSRRLAEEADDPPPFEDRQAGDLIGVVRIAIPMQQTNRDLHANSMILLATALVTAFLAMLAAYLIVRYVIVKPVLHLKDVSDGIARGIVDLRADIRTGDEFEELSHAFNRMLRHLVAVQEELRGVNANLDGKVDELAQVNLQLYEMNKMKDEFLATMSHELRTPLNSILGFSEILAKAENMSEKQKRYLNNIHLSGEDLMARINDVLDLAKIESGKMDLRPREFALADLVDRTVNSLMPLALKKNINLTAEASADVPILYQDSGKVQQILMNLLSNAIKYTPEGGRVRVLGRVCQKDEDRAEVIVEDTGVGIRLEEQETIFEKFRQGRLTPGQEDAMTRTYGGTGLGLSIVKELAKLLDGEVFLESEFGKGSTFIVRLPIRLPDSLTQREPPGIEDVHKQNLARRRIEQRTENAGPDAGQQPATGQPAAEQSTPEQSTPGNAAARSSEADQPANDPAA